MDFLCSKCHTDVKDTLKPCDRCKITLYCSRDCKKADWRSHKKVCAQRANSVNMPLLSPPRGLTRPIALPFHHLSLGIWLHGRPEGDVYRLLIDAYRLRVRDTVTLQGHSEREILFVGGLQGFLGFLDKVAAHQGFLPSWWSVEKRRACVDFGADDTHGYDISASVSKNVLVDRYGSSFFLMELRVFVQLVIGYGPGDIDTMALMVAFMEGEQSAEHMDQILEAARREIRN